MEPADETADWLECAACEAWATIPPTERAPDGSPLYEDGVRGTCPGCGAVSVVSVDPDGAYPIAVECKHGRPWDDGCGECEAEGDSAEDEGLSGPYAPGSGER